MISATKPFAKFHKWDEHLIADVQALNSSGYTRDDIHVLKWKPDVHHMSQGDNHYTYGKKREEADLEAKADVFAHGGKELRTRLEHLGFAKEEAAALVRKLEETDYSCILVVRDLRDDIIPLQ